MSDWIRTLRQDVEPLTGRVIDVVIWGGSRPHLLRETVETFREHAKFSGQIRYFFQDCDVAPELALEAVEVCRALGGFEAAIVHRTEHDGTPFSYGWSMVDAIDRWVRAPLMFSLEDDHRCLRDLPLDDAFDLFTEQPHVNQLRFNRRKNPRSRMHDGGEFVYARRSLIVGGRSLPFLGGEHWYFMPALWRMAWIRPRFKAIPTNVHHFLNSSAGLLSPGPRPSPDWYADTLGALTWGDVAEPPFFLHTGKAASVHDRLGRV